MEKHLFSAEELLHLKFIKENSPKRIWFEFIQYVFEYENFHFLLEIKAAKKITYDVQNFNNYAMKTAITFVNEKYIPQESCQLLMENETIEEIQIIRTKLYFSEPKKNGQQYYSCECNQINPEKSPPTNSDLKEIIVVDVGVSLIFENKQVVNFFINDNDDDFYSNENSTQKEDFKKELEQKYQFVDLK